MTFVQKMRAQNIDEIDQRVGGVWIQGSDYSE